MAASPHIVVMGAGSVGCFLGGAWKAAGAKVSLLGRVSVRDEIATQGMTLSDFSGWRIHLAHDLVDFHVRPAILAKADVIALCVKSHATAVAAREIGRHGRKGATVVSFQNGVSNVEALRSKLPRFEIVPGMVPFNVARLGPASWHKGTSGDLAVGESDATRMLGAQLNRGPARLTLVGDMTALAWGKLLMNLNNAVNALSRRTLLDELGERDYRRVVAASIVEALDLLGTAGIEPAQVGPIPPKLLPHAIAAPNFIFKNLLLRVQKIDAKARSSMADDLAAGRETEIDYLNGEIVKLARSLGRDAPVNRTLVDLVKQAEAGVDIAWSPEELRKYVLQGHREVAPFGY